MDDYQKLVESASEKITDLGEAREFVRGVSPAMFDEFAEPLAELTEEDQAQARDEAIEYTAGSMVRAYTDEIADRRSPLQFARGTLRHFLRKSLGLDPLRNVVDFKQAPREQQRRTLTATPFVVRPLQARQWLHAGHYIRSYVTATAAPPGMGKTTNAIVEILEMVLGYKLIRAPRIGSGAKPLRVWYVNGEDPRNEIELRFQAAMQHFGVTQEDVAGRLFIDSGREHDFIVARDEARKFAYATPVVGNVIEGIKADAIDCFIADPAVAFHRVPENDNSKIEIVADAFRDIADATNTAVELIAHTRKTNGNAVTVEDVRGAYSIIGAARSVRVANIMTKEEAAAAGLAPGKHVDFFRVDNVKSNMTARAPASTWRCLVSVSVPVEDEDGKPAVEDVGTCEPWCWPSKEDARSILADVVADASAPVRDLTSDDLAVLELIEQRLRILKPVVYGNVSPNSAPKLLSKGARGGKQKRAREDAVYESVEALIANGKLHIDEDSSAHQQRLERGPRRAPFVSDPDARKPWSKR